MSDDANERMHAEVTAMDQAIRDQVFLPGSWVLRPDVTEASPIYAYYYGTWVPYLHQWIAWREGASHESSAQTIVGDAIDDAMERLHADIMEFGQALRDRIYVPGTWTLRPGATSTDSYRFYASSWEPFLREWLHFRSEKRDIPMQTLPGSGTASALRNYRERFVQLLTQAKQEWLLTGTSYVPPQWARVGSSWVDVVGRGGKGASGRGRGYYGDRHRRY